MPETLRAVDRWFQQARRDLPWRRPDVPPWGVLVSEVMLQQTPVARVVPAWPAWLHRWPDPVTTSSASAADLVRQWDRLGYPRRAVRLGAAATICVQQHGGQLPDDVAALRALPGVGEYTARAVSVFAFGRREPVVDVNVARVLRRALLGRDDPGPAIAADRALCAALLPTGARASALRSAGLMELGALVCRSRDPKCGQCPVQNHCAWRAAGQPPWSPPRQRQKFAGSDRQARGLLLAALRSNPGPVPVSELTGHWPEQTQSERALAALVADGLAVRCSGGYALPGDTAASPSEGVSPRSPGWSRPGRPAERPAAPLAWPRRGT